MSNTETLKEVLEGIEAFVQDMEKLGVPVHVDVVDTPADVGPQAAINLRALVRKDLEEVPEVRPRGP